MFVMMNLQLLRNYFIILCGIKERIKAILVLRKLRIILFTVTFQLEGIFNGLLFPFVFKLIFLKLDYFSPFLKKGCSLVYPLIMSHFKILLL